MSEAQLDALVELIECLRRIETGGPLHGDVVDPLDWIEWAQTDAHAALTHPAVRSALSAEGLG